MFVLNTVNSDQAVMYGRRGRNKLEFRDPSGIAVDDVGNMLVVDSRNHRLQLVSEDMEYLGVVRTDTPLTRPGKVHLDTVNKQILVTNQLSKTLVRYQL